MASSTGAWASPSLRLDLAPPGAGAAAARRQPRTRRWMARTESRPTAGDPADESRLTAKAGSHPAQGPAGLGFIVWGPPGTGKTTTCDLLSELYGLVHVHSGDLLRAHVLYKTKMGLAAKPFVEAGKPVPDELVVGVVIDRLKQSDCRTRGWLLDGFPRTAVQDEALREAGFHCRQTFVLHAPRSVLEARIFNRLVDPETGKLYNSKTLPAPSQDILERLVPMENRQGDYSDRLDDYAASSGAMMDRLAGTVISVDAQENPRDIARAISVYIELAGLSSLSSKADEDENDANDTAPLEATPRAPAAVQKVRKSKVPVTLIRCDGYMCERESVENSSITFRGAATEQVMLVWNEKPKTVLLLVKKDPSLTPSVLSAARLLVDEHNAKIIVEPFVQTAALANGMFLEAFTRTEDLHEEIDVVVCLGGDGLILHASTLFKTAVPPVISFNLGTLGFLTPFEFEDFKPEMESVMNGNCLVNLRMRLTCRILHADGTTSREFQALNEVVVDRGASPHLSNLDCFCDDMYITTVQADGIIMSTPTGSTAYSMSAGGSMVHPSVPAILFTPICPHSLSFRPIVFPDAAKLRIDVSVDSRSHSWASFDGKSRQRLRRGDGLLVEMSSFPVPTINKTDHTGDWFGSLDRAFNFNTRGAVQKRTVAKKTMTEDVSKVDDSLPVD